MALIEIPPGTPTDIVGAEEVWASGGRVFICPLEPGPDGEKYSTSALIARMKERKEKELKRPNVLDFFIGVLIFTTAVVNVWLLEKIFKW